MAREDALKSLSHAQQHLERVRKAGGDPVDWFEKWPSNSAREWVKQLVQIASGDANICAIVAFGSIVRDVEHSVDADILLVYECEKPAFEPPPLDVDLKAYHKTDIEALLAEGHELLCWSVRFGKVLHEKEYYWTSLHNKYQCQCGAKGDGRY